MKKILSLVLVITMLFASSTLGFASEKVNQVSETNIENQIQLAKTQEYERLYKQLREQGALELMDLFMEELDPIIEAEVRMANSNKVEMEMVGNANKITLNYPNGGLVSYKNSINAYVLSTYLPPSLSKKYIVSNTEMAIGTVAVAALGSIPAWGGVLGALFSFRLFVTSSGSEAVKEANGYAQVMNISDASGAVAASYVRGWTTHPKIIIYTDGLSDIKYQTY